MASNSTYDVIIVGSGPGGYVAAVRTAQLGLTVACIEKAPRLGGVCLNVGCIPSKALLDSSEYVQLAKNQFSDHGIKTGRISLDLAVMMARKEKVVQDLTDNVKRLLEGHKVEIIQGTARLAADDQVTVETDSGSSKKKQRTTLSAKAIILATGSETVPLPDLPFDGQQIISSTD
jgi:dihydrolipoamide dehydrogenase